MKTIFVLTRDEVQAAKNRLHELRQVSLMARDAGDTEGNREYYLKAKGFEECMNILGIYDNKKKFRKDANYGEDKDNRY